MIKKEYAQFEHYGGYHESDEGVRAFSHLHLVGAGVMDMGVIGVLPVVARKRLLPPVARQERITRMTKEEEIAEPGYYSTYLSEEKIRVELTTTQRCGVHRYSYNNTKNNPMDINIMTSFLLSRKSTRSSTTTLCGQKCVEGSIKVTGGFGGRFGGYTIHYHL
jgi:putative alpha-1,2-mannosidase